MEYLNFINGKEVKSASGRVTDVIDPYTQKVIAKVQRSNKEDVNLAVESARKAFDMWGNTTPAER